MANRWFGDFALTDEDILRRKGSARLEANQSPTLTRQHQKKPLWLETPPPFRTKKGKPK